MLWKKASPEACEKIKEKLCSVFTDVQCMTDAPVKQYMIKWLSAFAPDMTYAQAKSFCLPRLLYKNHLWNAFAFEKAPCLAGEEADDAAKDGFLGDCFVLAEEENLLFSVKNETPAIPEKIKDFKNIAVFTKDFSRTYIYTGEDGFGPYFKTAEE